MIYYITCEINTHDGCPKLTSDSLGPRVQIPPKCRHHVSWKMRKKALSIFVRKRPSPLEDKCENGFFLVSKFHKNNIKAIYITLVHEAAYVKVWLQVSYSTLKNFG